MLYEAKMLQFADFPTTEVLGPDASEEAIKALIDKHGLIGKATDLKTALKKKVRLYGLDPLS